MAGPRLNYLPFVQKQPDFTFSKKVSQDLEEAAGILMAPPQMHFNNLTSLRFKANTL
jgi:hypothetical protein